MMSGVCKDTEIKPKLTPSFGEELQGRTSNNSNKAKVDIRTFRFLGMRAAYIFRLKGFRPQRMSLSQQVLATVPCYE